MSALSPEERVRRALTTIQRRDDVSRLDAICWLARRVADGFPGRELARMDKGMPVDVDIERRVVETIEREGL